MYQSTPSVPACDRSKVIGLRDYAIVSVMIFHGLRREEVTALTPARGPVSITVRCMTCDVRSRPWPSGPAWTRPP